MQMEKYAPDSTWYFAWSAFGAAHTRADQQHTTQQNTRDLGTDAATPSKELHVHAGKCTFSSSSAAHAQFSGTGITYLLQSS